MTRHYIAMNGSPGCLPDSCASHESKQDALDWFTDCLFSDEMLPDEITTLRTTGLVYFRGDRAMELGAGYAEIAVCDCDSPEDHNDD